MAVSSSHHPWANRAEINEVVDTVGALGLTRAAGGFGPDDFADLDAVKYTAETVNSLIEALSPHGLSLFLHNHWWEFAEIEGRLGYHWIAELCPEVQFEVDTYWAANFGAVDVAAEVARVKARTPLLARQGRPAGAGQGRMWPLGTARWTSRASSGRPTRTSWSGTSSNSTRATPT